jgi:hypothetical protein
MDVCLVAKEFEDAVNAGDVAAQRQIRLSVGTTVRSSVFHDRCYLPNKFIVQCSYVKCGKPCLSASRDKWTVS